MTTQRKNQIELQMFRTLQLLNEAEMVQPPPQQQQTPQAVANSNPMQALPGQSQQAQQQVVGSSGGEPINTSGEPLSIDTMIDRLNIIRGGKSFSDPEVYGQLTTLYKGLSDQDKVSLDNVLTAVGKIVAQQQQTQPSTAGQSSGPPPGQPSPSGNPQAASQPSAAPAATTQPTAV